MTPENMTIAEIEIGDRARLSIRWLWKQDHYVTELGVSYRDRSGGWSAPSRSITVPHGALWQLGDAITRAQTMASKERR